MLFNSIEFLIFSSIFFILWPLFNKKNSTKWPFIVISSFIFYGWWDWRFLFLIIISGFIDFFSGILIKKKKKYSKVFLILSLASNLGLLFIFKYSLFVGQFVESVFYTFGYTIFLVKRIPEFTLILPVGISFYTFQSMSYTIDIYKKRMNPTYNILHFFSFLAMFPQLVAGPIVRAKDILGQLEKKVRVNPDQKWKGIKLIVFGLFQKTVIADNLSFFIDSAYSGQSPFDGTLFWWTVIFAFSFQIYCDFAGYSLIAIGLAKYMGYKFKINFNHPYIANNFKNFWSRWHISLSTWFRDYVYIPLGGSKKGKTNSILYLSITMVLSGVWHGANYGFLLWGGVHAILLILDRITNFTYYIQEKTGKITSVFVTFTLVSLSWVFFRSPSLSTSISIFEKLFTFNDFSYIFIFYSKYFSCIMFLFFAIFIEAYFYFKENYNNNLVFNIKLKYWLEIITVSLTVVLILVFRGEGKSFIYFQF